jgi:arylsulfatase A-like enzyme
MNSRLKHSLRFCMAQVLLVLFIGLTILLVNESHAAEKPNFIFINIDDLGYADIGPFGSKKNKTPNLDQMAKEGRKLTCFYAAPVCSPSRASLMTGCYPKRALSIPHVLFPGNAEGLHQNEVTVAELLKKQGYATGIVGKWHLGDQPEFLPTRHGFDYYYGLPYSNDMGPASDGVKSNLGKPLPKRKNPRRGQPPLPLLRNETVLQRVLQDDQQALVENYTNEAVSFLYKHRDEPFFLYLPHSAVHFPLYPGKAFVGHSKNGLYSDWVEEVDWSVGRILETVRTLGLDKNTMVIFTSDNGGSLRHGAVNLPLRGGKGSTFEGGMRVPTVAWWPGRIPAGSMSDEIASTMDILPTLTKLAGGKVPNDRKIDGGDIWPILSGAKDGKTPYKTFYFFRGLNLQAVRSGPWKLHLAKGDLYNLADDIAEAKNVAANNPDVVKRLTELAVAQDKDLGRKEKGPGVRPLGKASNPQPLIAHDGTVRPGHEPETGPIAGQGIMVGEVTVSSAQVQIRLTQTDHLVKKDVAGASGVVRFNIEPIGSKSPGPENVTMKLVKAAAENDYIAKATFTNLRPGQAYLVKTHIGADKAVRKGPTASFRTLPGGDSATSVKFVVVTGMNYAKFHGDDRIDRKQHLLENNTELPKPYGGADKHLGYPSLDSILRVQPHFFVGTGDNVYYDTPDTFRAKTATEMRQKWHEQFVQPRYRQLFAKVPTYWMIDDHDYRIDDGDNSGDYEPSPATARAMMLEQLPLASGGASNNDAKTYRTHRINKDLQVWFPENRMYRSANATKDGPAKTIWGKTQKEWLKKTLAESDATFKLLISPTPMVGPDDLRKTDNHTNAGGFQHERDEFFAWLKSSGVLPSFSVVCGDRHWQYHSVHPSGVEEFSSGALVDANSRPGRKPGDPKGTDPKGLIKQPYSQKTRSGGFLLIEVSREAGKPATLSYKWHNVRGKVFHEHTKSGD